MAAAVGQCPFADGAPLAARITPACRTTWLNTSSLANTAYSSPAATTLRSASGQMSQNAVPANVVPVATSCRE